MVETLVDDLDGAPAAETVQIGWNGDWRELDLSKRNVAALSRALERLGGGAASPDEGTNEPTPQARSISTDEGRP